MDCGGSLRISTLGLDNLSLEWLGWILPLCLCGTFVSTSLMNWVIAMRLCTVYNSWSAVVSLYYTSSSSTTVVTIVMLQQSWTLLLSVQSNCLCLLVVISTGSWRSAWNLEAKRLDKNVCWYHNEMICNFMQATLVAGKALLWSFCDGIFCLCCIRWYLTVGNNQLPEHYGLERSLRQRTFRTCTATSLLELIVLWVGWFS